ncbi:hypothetical protein DYH09_31025 [bacterium CPR1]|nr:hypothetical protein [bacterium CPR1]
MVLLLLVTVGCSRPATGRGDQAAEVQLTVQVTPGPRVGDNLLQVEVLGGEPARLEVEATMSHAGMTPVLAPLTRVEGARWQAPLKLTMAGDWILILRGELKDGRKLERQIPLPGVVASP